MKINKSALRATFVALVAFAGFALAPSAVVAQAPPGSLWYNGDFNGINGLANEQNTTVAQASVYDDFNVTASGGWLINSVFSDNLATTNFTGASWEIRSGVSEGNGGTLIASGTTNNPTITLTGRSGFGFSEYQVQVTGLSVFLPMLAAGQHYWLNVTPIGDGTGRSFNSTTSGSNAVGQPPGNDQNAFFNSTTFGANFTSTANESQPYDFSNGVIGIAVPEPSTWAMIGLGGALLLGMMRFRARAS